ncbi:YggS family pyridoxal phosphate-dependent enzyme [Nafulsella turpanensis]|uniref:YggS family pyridoxal phosphate-dependent enzyme n=1 Tax=Nafulsella turpanensis TaxID=1265690 RepID=UPI00047719EF|nr:YggS family pyridoxal phosphate-dependent enzyme [Nafulsella turpanensis]
MNIAENIKRFENIIQNDSCTLIAVSKTKPVEDILEAYEAGLKDFGENKVQELTEKFEQLPKDIRWHMIGHLQRNKVKYIASFVHLIHSVDSWRLLKEINKQGEKVGRTINCLLQVHIAREETKFGLSEEELLELLQSPEFAALGHIQVTGLMGMATNTENLERIREEFHYLRELFDRIRTDYTLPNAEMKELSMGMSSDYLTALEEGSTMVRIGSALFGSRNYH